MLEEPTMTKPNLNLEEKQYVAHHFNNALAIAFGSASMIKKGKNTEDIHKMLDDSLVRLMNLVNKLTKE